MLSGFLVFNADTGALVYHRRYEADFGLPNAKQQLWLADPVGLALQLYAFSRFSTSLPNSPQLQSMRFGELSHLGNVFLASEQIPDDEGQPAVHLTLAAFGDLPQDLGSQLAKILLHDFIEENTNAVRVLHPAGDAASEPAPQKTWHFHSLDITLESMVDWLVGYLAKSLPQFPKWACLLCFEEETSLRKWEKIAVAHASPPPPCPPKERSDRRPQSFAKRIIQGGFAAMSSLSPRRERPASSSGAPVARGQMSWWRRGSIAADGALTKAQSLQLTCFWFEASEDTVLPSKTSTPVLELATALLESSSINVGSTLVQLQPHFWFYQATGSMHCVAFHLQPTRIYFVVPLHCLFGQGMPEKWDHSMLQSVCSGVRQRISSELACLVRWLESKAGGCGFISAPKKKRHTDPE
ncbi:unnamed protein product [Cladocopium goreaui]|uniref:Uncharacterized protein n=1 Tax=Cladocopium goreaui TaxID=2562237 RepID=A0A9P1D387_9DINO|nr:unnamed protein product [Cladocopium goreaui]